MVKCRFCGKEEDPEHWICRDSLIREQLCFSCYHWQERYDYDQSHPEEAVVIDGVHYYIDDEDSKSHFRGFGGAKFVIQFNDGRVVNTTNLWCQGEVPPEWRDKFPDNAQFIPEKKWKKVGDCEYLFPKDEEIPDSLISEAETQIGM